MNKVRLGDIADVSAGGTPARGNRSFWGGGIPWIKISDIKSKYVNSYDETIALDGLENSSAKLFPKGTILYTIFATLGRVGILDIDATTNQAIAGIQVKSPVVDPNYLYHFLCSQEKRVNEIGKGVAQKNINLSILRDWIVPLPAINVQKRVSATLDQIRDGIEKNKVSSRLLDEQVKSLFNEMFGDSNRFPKKTGSSLFKLASGKFLDAEHRLNHGVPVYGGNGIAWYTDVSMIDYDTIIIGRVGALCGNVRLAKGPKWITDNALYIKEFKTNDLELPFLECLLQMKDLRRFAMGGAQPKITQKPIEEMEFIIPGKSLQTIFVKSVLQINKLRFMCLMLPLDVQKMDDYALERQQL